MLKLNNKKHRQQIKIKRRMAVVDLIITLFIYINYFQGLNDNK
jgi:hypothetical protein